MKEKVEKKDIVRNLKMSWKIARNHKRSLFAYLFFTIILAVIGSISPLLSAKELIKLNQSLWEELLYIALFIFTVEIIRNICRFCSMLNSQIFFKKVQLDIQMELAKQTLRLETKVLDENSSGVFISRLNRDTNDIANIFTQLNYSITDMIANIGIMLAVLHINIYMFFFFVGAFVFIFILRRMQMKAYFKHDKTYRKLNEQNTGLITEFIRGMRDIKSLNAGDNFIQKMKEHLQGSNEEQYKMSRVERIYTLVIGSIQDLLELFLIILGIFLVSKNLLSTENFIILYMYRYVVFNLLAYVSQFIESFKNFNLSASRVFEIIDSEKYSKEQFGSEKLTKIQGDFAFENVHFSYQDNHPILNGINFTVKANETVAFVGKSGAGKSTIFGLLNKLYDVQKGKITIDGNDIQNLTKDSIRNNMTIITQNPYIFNFTIRENLTIVKPDATEEEMIEACKTASLHDFIMSLENGYDTKVGEGGVNLSGGERQRLSIARALIKKTEIILFDEATSALDNETQRSVQDAINHMKGEYTILIIAHRLSTVINSNRILVVDDGKIIGDGTHKNLLKTNKFYKKLYEEELKDI